MSYHTEDWEYHLANAYDKFDEASDCDNLHQKIHLMTDGFKSLCDHLNVIQKEYLNNIKDSDSNE